MWSILKLAPNLTMVELTIICALFVQHPYDNLKQLKQYVENVFPNIVNDSVSIWKHFYALTRIKWM